MTFAEMVQMAEQASRWRDTHFRHGQFLFNLIGYVRPDITDVLRATQFDCFYVDSRIPDFWLKVEELW